MKNIDTVKRIYEAFGKGDVPTILSCLAADVEWEYGAVDNDVPWLARRRGREGATAFFGAVMENLDMKTFAVEHVMADETVVVALIRLEAVVRRTGKTVREEAEPHIWTFGPDGKVVRFRHAADTLGHARALRGEG